MELNASADGKFGASNMAPGVYHLLAFKQPQNDIEYRNPEAMRAYDGKGQTIRLSAGQKEQVQLSLILASE